MVSYKEVQASNVLINDQTGPRISVFVGGTSGIGNLTLKALVATGASTRTYLVGRPSSGERMHAFIREMRALNPKAQVIWMEGEIALLAEVKRVCELITAKESVVDLLFLSAGYAPLGARTQTAEGLETAQSLEVYSRALFTLHLLPLLRKSEAPRVVSVLGGGLERADINLQDLGLKNPGVLGGLMAQMHYVTMNTVIMEKLAQGNSEVTFLHSWPGSVNTGNVNRSTEGSTVMAWFAWLVLRPLIHLFSSTDEEAAQRHLFQCSSAVFGGRGVSWGGKLGENSRGERANGLFLVNYKCDCTPNLKVMTTLRKEAVGPVWEHTQDVLRPFL